MVPGPQVNVIGAKAVNSVAQVGGVGSDGNTYVLKFDPTTGNAIVVVNGVATAANQALILAAVQAIESAPILAMTPGAKASAASFPVVLASDQAAIPTSSAMGIASKAGNAFSASTSAVSLPNLITTVTNVALFQNPSNSTKNASINVRQLASNVAGQFLVYRDAVVTNVGNIPITAINELGGSTTTPQATLYQGGGSTPIAVSSVGRLHKATVIGSNATDRESLGGCEIIAPGHSILITFQPYTLLSYGLVAFVGLDWLEG